MIVVVDLGGIVNGLTTSAIKGPSVVTRTQVAD